MHLAYLYYAIYLFETLIEAEAEEASTETPTDAGSAQ